MELMSSWGYGGEYGCETAVDIRMQSKETRSLNAMVVGRLERERGEEDGGFGGYKGRCYGMLVAILALGYHGLIISSLTPNVFVGWALQSWVGFLFVRCIIFKYRE